MSPQNVVAPVTATQASLPQTAEGRRQQEGNRKESEALASSLEGPNAPAPVPAAPLTTGVCWRWGVGLPSRLQAFRFGGGRGLRCPQSVSTLWALGPAPEMTAHPTIAVLCCSGKQRLDRKQEERLPTVPGEDSAEPYPGTGPAGGQSQDSLGEEAEG